MIVQSIIGRAGAGKSRYCLESIHHKLIDSPQGPPIIYLVPEQMTFQAEYALVTGAEIQGMIRAQVYSFTRLAWRVLQETGGLSRRHLDAAGIHMLLRKSIEKHKEQFLMYGKAAEQQGFMEQLEQMLLEYKRHCVTPEMLREIIDALAEKSDHLGQRRLLDKLRDIHQIYREFTKETRNKYISSEDYLTLLADRMIDSRYIREAEVWIDGFYSFTPQEMTVLQTLMACAKKVYITHTLDKEYQHHLPNEWNMFYSAAKAYRRVRAIAESVNARILPPIVLERNAMRHQASLAHLEAMYNRRPVSVYEHDTEIAIAEAVSQRAEIEGVAREILHKVRDGNYRYRDLAIVLRNAEAYGNLIETIFKDYQIPYFLDQKKTMLHHPLIELLRSVFDVLNQNWSYEAVFRCVKTDLMFDIDQYDDLQSQRELYDVLENYVLEQGIRGKRWIDETPWGEQEPSLDECRQRIAKPLAELEQAMRACEQGRQLADAIYRFLETLHIPEKIALWHEQAIQSGDLQLAMQHDQAWQAVIELLDQMVDILGDQATSIELFSDIMGSGLENLKFSHVPPAFDQVLVADLDHSRLSGIRCTFFIGINEGIIPAKIQDEGMLSEEEREVLERLGMELAPNARRRLMDEPFTIYNALAGASDELWVSYPLADSEGRALLPSPLIRQLTEMFPKAKRLLISLEPHEEIAAERQLLYVNNPEKTISYVTSQLRHWKRGYPIDDVWWDTYNWYVDEMRTKVKATKFTQRWKKSIGSLYYENAEYKLSKQVSEQLYGKQLKLSVSRLETYKSCPFAQFVSHGLRLKERKMFRLQPPDIGQLFHSSLSLITEQLRDQGRDWADVSEKEFKHFTSQAIEQLVPQIQNKILLSSHRYQYVKHRLQEVVSRTSAAIARQAKGSGFVPIGVEIGFGTGELLAPMRFELEDDAVLELRGRIDRIDRAQAGDQMLLRVIDYKSSQTSMDFAKLYDGTSLQMLAYLEIAIQSAERWLGQAALPAGALYFHVHNPMIQTQEVLTYEQLERELFKAYKLRGLVLNDPNIVKLMDGQLSGDGACRSDIIPVALKKDGSFDGRSSVVTLEQFRQLCEHTKQLIRRMGLEILDGVIDINPYRLKQRTACTFCMYRAICQFDPSMAEQMYRAIPLIKNLEQLLYKIEQLRRSEGGERNASDQGAAGGYAEDGCDEVAAGKMDE